MTKTTYICDVCGKERETTTAWARKMICTSIAPMERQTLDICETCNSKLIKAKEAAEAKVFSEMQKLRQKRAHRVMLSPSEIKTEQFDCKCSECGTYVCNVDDYCPKCGKQFE